MDPYLDLQTRVRAPLRWTLEHPGRAVPELLLPKLRACASVTAVTWAIALGGCAGLWVALAWLFL